MQRGNQRNQTVAVGGAQFAKLEQDASVLRKAERSNTMPVTFRRGDIALKKEDQEQLEENQKQLAGRVRRGSVQLSQTTSEQLSSHWESCDFIKLHVHGKQSDNTTDNKPGAEREGVLFRLREPKVLYDDYGFFYSCTKGAKGYNDTSSNQDNFSFTVYGDYSISIVMDGHGPCGHRVSARCVQTIPYYLTRSEDWLKDIPKALKDAFASASTDLIGYAIENDVDVQASGSTCVLFMINTKTGDWYTANVGDSRVVIGYENEKDVVFETLDHKPSVEAEKKRIEASNGEIRTLTYDDFSVDRIFVKGTDYPGLCMSRSFGDECVKPCGVTSEPEIATNVGNKTNQKIDLLKNPFVVIASDGVWEFIESSWCIKAIVKKLSSEPADRVVQKLAKESRRRWKLEEGDYCDDITVCLLQLGKTQK